MSNLSVLIPSRNEKYLTKTVCDVFAKARGSIQVIVCLDGGDWPEKWDETAERFAGKLITIYRGQSQGMRSSINACVNISSGEWLLKTDAHCMFDDGFDVKLIADCEPNWIVIPRRYPLDPEAWRIGDNGKPPVDYEYMAPPTAEKPFQGKVWRERAIERAGILLDKTPTFQGSCWMMRKEYFRELELFDDVTYGSFFNEAQEMSLKAWLSGGEVRVNKKSFHCHFHKPRDVGRGYSLESGLREQATAGLRKWIDGKGWHKQTLPLSSLSDHFGTMPGW